MRGVAADQEVIGETRSAEALGELFGWNLGWLEKPRKSRLEAEVKPGLWSGLLKCKRTLVRTGLIAFEEIVAGELKKGKVLHVWRVPAIQNLSGAFLLPGI